MPFNLSEDTVDALLDKLSTDDAFRDQFQKNPRKALGAVGHGPAEGDAKEGAWMCMRVAQLASKQTIQASRDALRKQLLSSQAGQSPITLEMKKA